MKFFIESHTILKNRSGVGWFTHGLVKGMQSHLQPNDSIRLLTHPREPIDIDDLMINQQTVNIPIDWLPPQLYHALKHRNCMPPIDLIYGKGIYIFPNFIRWPLLNSPSVIVVHDLSMFLYEEYALPANLKFMSRHLPPSIDKADLIVAVSKSTKQGLCDHFNVDPAKVIVSMEAAEPSLYYHRPDEEVRQAKGKYGIFGKYLLFVSTLEPRKNLEGLIAAFRNLPKTTRDGLSLVLVGGRGWQDDDIRTAIREAREAGDRVILPGYVDTEDLPRLYSGAEAFVFPSHYEGFGLPILEAMSCGTPVITGNNSSLPEAGGKAAMYIDSANQQDLTEAIKKMLSDRSLRERHIAKGYKQAATFSWEKSAGTVLEAIKERKLI